MKGRIQPVVAIVAAIVLAPAIVWAAAGSFTSSSSTPAVKAVNSYSGGKGVAGYATSTSGTTHIGVYGSGSGAGGYGVYSNGPLGISSGATLKCSGCVTAADLAASAQPSIVTKDGSVTSIDGSDGNTCTNLGSITITAAAPGKITVDADFHLTINHASGTSDWFQAMFDTTFSGIPDDCPTGSSLFTERYIDSTVANSSGIKETLHVMKTFTATAGSHTYYLNFKWPFGGDAGDLVWSPNLRAMFFPS